ncbi:S8 family serine peptidase [Pseudoxanthomonas sp. JBR18]|uniref:S8 family serine peptidase n=1 Tax=Pseudoxanthomonas sp. JBR18 TaxID=2969308 RepID=UPI00230587A4|nr:S8 family serine peptidase [Pseudoxanthomonas sp. JBR18]WCE03604.1 S8 family serine peptidase [Pseudoxanthomonas sp. JBR18]
MDPALQELLRVGNEHDAISAIVRLDPLAPLPDRIRLVVRFGDIATVRVRRGDVAESYACEAVASFKAPYRLMPEPAASLATDTTVADATDLRRRDDWPTGDGVLIAALDWGFDFTHPDFRHPDGSTRLRALWDQSASYDPAHPNLYGYGRIHLRQDIDRALASEAPFRALGYDPRRSDHGPGAHATHVMGIAAGNGRVAPVGVAPQAELAFVQLAPSNGRPGRAPLTDSPAVLEGLHFIDTLAGADAACINMSLGTHCGPHDGTALVEQGIDAFLQARPDRIVVQSTGNYFARRIHASGRLGNGQTALLPILIDQNDTTANDIEIWYRGCDAVDARVMAPDGRMLCTVPLGAKAAVIDNGIEIGRLYHRRHDPNNGDHQITLRLDAPAAAGRWTLALDGRQIADGHWHAWIERDSQCAACQSHFPDTRAATGSTTGSICNGHRTLVVGAYDARAADAPLARFSSSGPTRDGRTKPDLLAPGVRVLSARSASRREPSQARAVRMSGTSMAAPHVTGAAALLFQAGGATLGHARIRALLCDSATPYRTLNAADRLRAGAGRLDIGAALSALRATATPRPSLLKEQLMDTLHPTDDHNAAPSHPPTDAIPTDQQARAVLEVVQAVVDTQADDAPEDAVEYVVRRRRAAGPIIAPVIGPGGVGAALVTPMGSGIGLAIPVGAAAPATAPTQSPPIAPPPCACAHGAPTPIPDVPVTVASDAPTITDAVEQEAPWLVTERDAAQAADSYLAANAFEYTGEAVEDADDGRQAQAWSRSTAWPVPAAEYDEIAESAVAEAPTQSSARFVSELLARAAHAEHDRFDPDAPGAARLPARLFDHFSGRRPGLPDTLARQFDLVAAPGQQAPAMATGDWLLRRSDGTHAQLSVLAAPGLWRGPALRENGFRLEGRHRDGGFVHVIEPGHRPALRDDRFARRVTDTAQRVLPDTLVLRPRLPNEQTSWSEEVESVDARWIQQALNRALGIQLTVDGVIGAQSRAAILAFQQQQGLVADGIVGPRTEAALRQASGSTATTHQSLVPAAPSGGVGDTTDCTTLDGFAQGRDTLLPTHHTQLIALARRIQRERIGLVEITGFASSEGEEINNFTLGLRRAESVRRGLQETLERMRPGSSTGVAMMPLSRGESSQIADGDRPRNRRVQVCLRRPVPVPVPPRPVTQTKVFQITGKSFIATIGSNIGSLDCSASIGPIPIPGSSTAANAALHGLALATDASFQENPTSQDRFRAPPPEGKGYRLFSQGQVQATFRGADLLSVGLRGALDTDAGKECLPSLPACLQAPPLIIDQPFSTRRIDASRIRFRWGVKGEPHQLAKAPFDVICRRPSVFIWHEIIGTIDVSSGVPLITSLFIQGSRFPSHRCWLDGVVQNSVRQGPMSNLWDGSASDPTRVR